MGAAAVARPPCLGKGKEVCAWGEGSVLADSRAPADRLDRTRRGDISAGNGTGRVWSGNACAGGSAHADRHASLSGRDDGAHAELAARRGGGGALGAKEPRGATERARGFKRRSAFERGGRSRLHAAATQPSERVRVTHGGTLRGARGVGARVPPVARFGDNLASSTVA